MYIWILLATIMIALSFFNLSPRTDKETAFTETKAASLVNRFRIEHSAFSRVAECKMIKSTSQALPITRFPNTEQDSRIWEEKALPIGYQKGGDLLAIHYIYCLKADLSDGSSPLIDEDCTSSLENPAYRYSVSYAPVPSRWRSKSETDSDNPANSVLPVLGNALAKQYIKGSVLGILNCDNAGTCAFQGSNAYERQKDTGLTRLSFQKGGGSDFYTKLFENEDFVAKCAGNICLFALHKLSNKDVDEHCATLYEGDFATPDEGTGAGDEDDNINSSIEITKEDEGDIEGINNPSMP